MSDLLGKWRSAKLPEVPGSGEVCEQVANSRLCSSLGVGGYCDRPRKVPEQEKEVLAPLASPAMPARACAAMLALTTHSVLNLASSASLVCVHMCRRAQRRRAEPQQRQRPRPPTPTGQTAVPGFRRWPRCDRLSHPSPQPHWPCLPGCGAHAGLGSSSGRAATPWRSRAWRQAGLPRPVVCRWTI